MLSLAYTILFVRDMERSVAFYRDLAGLPLLTESPDWSEFATGSCKLALHLAAEGTLSEVQPQRIPAGHVHPGFAVADIHAFAARMEAAGVPLMNPIRREDFGLLFGTWRDPDGIPVAVVQMPA